MSFKQQSIHSFCTSIIIIYICNNNNKHLFDYTNQFNFASKVHEQHSFRFYMIRLTLFSFCSSHSFSIRSFPVNSAGSSNQMNTMIFSRYLFFVCVLCLCVCVCMYVIGYGKFQWMKCKKTMNPCSFTCKASVTLYTRSIIEQNVC